MNTPLWRAEWQSAKSLQHSFGYDQSLQYKQMQQNYKWNNKHHNLNQSPHSTTTKSPMQAQQHQQWPTVKKQFPQQPIQQKKQGKTIQKQHQQQTAIKLKRIQTQSKQQDLSNYQQKYVLKKYKKPIGIIQHLQKRHPQYVFTQKSLVNHSKKSEMHQIIEIIDEMLDKFQQEGRLSTTDQYIMSGYLAKYYQNILSNQNSHNQSQQPFRYKQQLQHYLQMPQNKKLLQQVFKCSDLTNSATSPSRVSPQKKSSRHYNTTKKSMKSKNELVNQYKRLLNLWDIYQLRAVTCPTITKLSEIKHSHIQKQLQQLLVKLRDMHNIYFQDLQEKKLDKLYKTIRLFENNIEELLK